MISRTARPTLLTIILTALVSAALPSGALAGPPALKVSNEGRSLLKADGTPFFWQGDTNWRLYKLKRAQVQKYLQNRSQKEFNVIQGPVLLHDTATGDFVNAYGHGNTSATQPNEAWFNHIDFIVNEARKRDLYIALVATWGDTWQVFGSNPSQRVANARSFGTWLGQRYRNDRHVIWIVAGEYAVEGTGGELDDIWSALGEGLAAGSGGNNLITIHGSFQPGVQSSSVVFHDAPWLDFNMIQSSQSGDWGPGASNWELVAADYDLNPVKPTIDAEAHYEGLAGWNSFGVRRRAYWSVFEGAFGHTYGAHGVWGSYRTGDEPQDFGAPEVWTIAMNYAGAYDMKHLRHLIESRPMLKRVPGDDFVASWAGNVPTRIEATRDRNGRFAMVYVPEKNRNFTVDLSLISGSAAKAWWFDPRKGTAELIGNYPTNGAASFTTPNYGQDWVLVVDDAARGYPKPGQGGPLK